MREISNSAEVLLHASCPHTHSGPQFDLKPSILRVPSHNPLEPKPNPLPLKCGHARQGVYVYDSTGKKYLDWTSEAVCVNLGHTMPETVPRLHMVLRIR